MSWRRRRTQRRRRRRRRPRRAGRRIRRRPRSRGRARPPPACGALKRWSRARWEGRWEGGTGDRRADGGRLVEGSSRKGARKRSWRELKLVGVRTCAAVVDACLTSGSLPSRCDSSMETVAAEERVSQYCGLTHHVERERGPPAFPSRHAPSHTTASVDCPATVSVSSEAKRAARSASGIQKALACDESGRSSSAIWAWRVHSTELGAHGCVSGAPPSASACAPAATNGSRTHTRRRPGSGSRTCRMG